MKKPLFEPIRMERQAEYRKRLTICPEITSDYSFVNLFSWADEYDLSWAWTEELVWIKQNRPEEIFWAPVGPWPRLEWPSVLEKYALGQGTFTRVPKTLMNIWKAQTPERLRIRESREHWDYIYDIKELVNLRGNRFHKKKNLLNQFMKAYDYHFAFLKDDLIDHVLGMQESWCIWRDCEDVEILAQENRAIHRVLKNWSRLNGLVGGVIQVDQKIAAYTVGECLGKNSIIIHFEKGDPEFKGAYQAINQMFLEHVLSEPFYPHLELVNREQDLDDEGLRQAKLSYHPIGFLEKYQVRFT